MVEHAVGHDSQERHEDHGVGADPGEDPLPGLQPGAGHLGRRVRPLQLHQHKPQRVQHHQRGGRRQVQVAGEVRVRLGVQRLHCEERKERTLNRV